MRVQNLDINNFGNTALRKLLLQKPGMFWFQIFKFRYLSKLLKIYFHMNLIEFKYIRKVTRLKKKT